MSGFLFFSAILCILASIIWPLQSLLISQISSNIVVGGSVTPQMTLDADITGLSQGPAPLIIANVAVALATGSNDDSQPHLWQSPDNNCKISRNCDDWWSQIFPVDESTTDTTEVSYIQGNLSFVSNVVNSIDTGVFRNHGLRLNSSISCGFVADDEMPENCSTEESTISEIPLPGDQGTLLFRICLPPDAGSSPWQVTTRDRQDVTESMFLQLNTDGARYLWQKATATGITVQCNATTTAGYFELPSSDWNGLHYGPLLDTFDLVASIGAGGDATTYVQPLTYDDGWSADDVAGAILGMQSYLPNVSRSPTPGPLFTSTLAIFGSDTWFGTRANATSAEIIQTPPNATESVGNCSIDNIVPFRRLFLIDAKDLPLCASPSPAYYFGDLVTWLRAILPAPFSTATGDNMLNALETAFAISMFYANELSLQEAAAVQPWQRPIMSYAGQPVQRPSASLASIAVLSISILVYVLGLWSMVFYACSRRTWTSTLDALAMVRVGSHLKDEGQILVPGIGRVSEEELRILDETAGWLPDSNELKELQDDDVDMPARRQSDGIKP